MYTRNDNASCLVLVLNAMFWVTGIVGYVMNWENLFAYWPETGGAVNAPVIWWISLCGLFVPPLGTFMGYFF